ncbi:MAG: hypothetical protein HY586_00290 [Candidatus Omnitrophica bacterium]|nr:hypothetical protein [Candidatus Omnitrophota bacterium]
MKIKILYAGDSPVGGAANYLLGVLRDSGIPFRHVPPGEKIGLKDVGPEFGAFIFSDYSRKGLVPKAEAEIVRRAEAGRAGFLMIGGWGSFGGPFGAWRGSWIEEILPVTISSKDDRTNFPGGALMTLRKKHSMFEKVSFAAPPVICGLNRLKVRPGAETILSARKIETGELPLALAKGRGEGPCLPAGRVRVSRQEFPLFVIDASPRKRVAALATDVAPHWCGGMVDWGRKRRVLPVSAKIHVEVGDGYVRFVQAILRWIIHNEE